MMRLILPLYHRFPAFILLNPPFHTKESDCAISDTENVTWYFVLHQRNKSYGKRLYKSISRFTSEICFSSHI